MSKKAEDRHRVEKALKAAINKHAKLSERLDKKWEKIIGDLRKQLGDNCSHSWTEEYTWEHDDGYGRQKQMKKLVCKLCDKENLWPGLSQLWH
jgi:hypothetical protein